MNNMQAKAILEKEKLWESNERVKTAFDIAIRALETVEKIIPCYLGSPCEYQTENVNHNHGWISCSDRLPEKNTWVLVTRSNGIIDMDMYKSRGWICREDFVIAWRPLPEPYEEEKQKFSDEKLEKVWNEILS